MTTQPTATTIVNDYPRNPDPSPLQIRLEAINFSTSLAIARLREGHDSSPADVVAGAEAFTTYITGDSA
jgi:hypothetical protein